MRTLLHVNNDASGWKTINALRANSRQRNASEKQLAATIPGYEPKFTRVTIYGRWGKNNPNAPSRKNGYPKTWHGRRWIRCNLQDAKTIAVYVNPIVKIRSQWGMYECIDFKRIGH